MRLGPAKLFAKGSPGCGTALPSGPWADDAGTRRVTAQPQDKVNEPVWAARAEFREGRGGVLAPGAAAELIAVNRDPTSVAPEEPRRVKAEQATILAGEVAHGDLGVG